MLPPFEEVRPTKQQGQRSINAADAFLVRIPFQFINPNAYTARSWRNIVRSQMFAVNARDAIIRYALSLDWKIVPRDSSMQDELAGTIRYYTRLLEKSGYGSDLDWASHVEWVMGDLLDLPFGGISEIGRKEAIGTGRVAWIEPIDGGTCYPTYSYERPVVQMSHGKVVTFPRNSVARIYMSPRQELEYRGWGMAPPEKIFYALQLLAQGDKYYANLLLDVPPAGILDLGDMERESAMEWANSYKAMLANGGSGAFQIPVLYEHTSPVNFISLGKVPNDIMYDRITLRYGAMVCAGYGLTLSDIGIQVTSAGGETLAGAIRSERKSRKSGFAIAKAKLKYYFEQMLPPTLQFHWIDTDDEVNVAASRALLAFATASTQLIGAQVFTPDELRHQAVQSGLVTVNVSEDYQGAGVDKLAAIPNQNTTQNVLGSPEPASSGGNGEIVRYTVSISKSKFQQYVIGLGNAAYQFIDDLRTQFGVDAVIETKAAVTAQINNNKLWMSLSNQSPAPVVVRDMAGKVVREKHAIVSALLAKFVFFNVYSVYFDKDTLELSDSDRYNVVVNALSVFNTKELEKEIEETLCSQKSST